MMQAVPIAGSVHQATSSTVSFEEEGCNVRLMLWHEGLAVCCLCWLATLQGCAAADTPLRTLKCGQCAACVAGHVAGLCCCWDLCRQRWTLCVVAARHMCLP